MAKVSKRLACCVILGFILWQRIYSQNLYTNISFAFDENKKEVILLNSKDSVAAVSFQTLEAKYNHQKNKKSKTVYYPLATYINPTEISEVPVRIGTLGTTMHIIGTLHGDTAAKFFCEFSVTENGIKMELKTTHVSTNEFSFSFRMFAGKKINLNPVEFPIPTYVKVKKKFTRITIRDKSPYFIFQLKSPSPIPY